ncbi:MAG: oppA-G [Chlamydiia bacterium]|nr:oppA-G [Chlamydiia bacterium]
MRHYQTVTLLCGLLTTFSGCNSTDPKETQKIASEELLKPKHPLETTQEARFSINDAVATIDPRKARNLTSINIVRTLFEGLTAVNQEGVIVPAIAQDIAISSDQRTYLITLRDCTWSNGDPVTAADFEYSWKTTLDPEFRAPNAYQLFVIKNAKAAYEGKTSKDTVGIKVIDPTHLEVTLEQPTAYFKELLAFHPFFPVPQKMCQDSKSIVDGKVTNGPFVLDSWIPESEVIVKKNPHYWDAKKVYFNKVSFATLDETTALNMFENSELDFAGSPLSSIPPDAIRTLKEHNNLQNAPAAGTQIIRVNVERPLFTNQKIRQAFCYAIDRKGICDHIMQGGYLPARSFVPPCLHLLKNDFLPVKSVKNAETLFTDGLAELWLTKESVPTISLIYVANERNQKIAQALQQNWKDAFDLQVVLEPNESKTFYEKVNKKNYQLALGSWIADFNDPINFLAVFQEKTNGTNNTQWENKSYQALLEQSEKCTSSDERLQLLTQAETILMTELPIFPIFHYTYNFVQSKDLKNISISPTGMVDLKEASIGQKNSSN